MKKTLALAIFAVVILSSLSSACAPAAPAPTAAPPATIAPAGKAETQPAAKPPDDAKAPSKDAEAMAKYESLVEAAKKEGKIALSNSQAFTREAINESFAKKFGLQLDYLHMSGGDLFTRMRTERKADQYNVDIVLAGTTTLIGNLASEGMLDKLDDVLVLPEVADPAKYIDGTIPWLDPEHRTIRTNKYVQSYIAINTSIVGKDEIKTFKDLLNPKWKGKIAAHDPTVPGAGESAGTFLYVTFGEDFVRQLYLGQEAVLSRNEQQLSDWVGHGKYPIVVWGANATLIGDLQRDGLPVEAVFAQDAAALDAGSTVVGMVNKAPHPNVARLFVNWFLSKEGQEVWVKAYQRPVVRVDVDQSSIADSQKPKAGVKYLDTVDYDYITSLRSKALVRLREIITR